MIDWEGLACWLSTGSNTYLVLLAAVVLSTLAAVGISAVVP